MTRATRATPPALLTAAKPSGGPKAWSPSLVASLRECVAHDANLERIERPGDEMYREWSYRFGAICTKRPKRWATCCACGGRIAKGQAAYHVTYTETPKGPWAPWQRYFHIEACEVVPTSIAADTIADAQLIAKRTRVPKYAVTDEYRESVRSAVAIVRSYLWKCHELYPEHWVDPPVAENLEAHDIELVEAIALALYHRRPAGWQ